MGGSGRTAFCIAGLIAVVLLAGVPSGRAAAQEPAAALEAGSASLAPQDAPAPADERSGPRQVVDEVLPQIVIRGQAAAASGITAYGLAAPTVPQVAELPILVYHHVVPGGRAESEAARALFVTPDEFERHLKYLKDNGYQSISFADLANCLELGAPLPERPVILSFDDGWENQYAYAFPLLQKYGFTGTFYVVTNYLDHQNFMTIEQLRAMMAAGMVIGSHSRSHPALPSLGNQRRWDEIAASRTWLEERLGVTIDTFAYPYGSYNAGVAALVKAAGYRTARTVDFGTRATVDDLETLAGLTFQVYMRSYRNNVELVAGGTKR